MKRSFVYSLLLVGAAFGQTVDFELQTPPCSYVFPAGCGALGDAEGSSASSALVTVDTVNGAGFPCNGLQYARVLAFGPISAPAGGPYVGSGGTQLWIPIPAGATNVSFCWDFYNQEGGPSSSYNDGMSVDLVGMGCGPILANLVYADTNTAAGTLSDTGACGGFALETAPTGPNSVGPVALVAGAVALQVTVWNGGDNAVASDGVIDNIVFGGGALPCQLFFSSPLGPGSIQMDNTPCAPVGGASYLNAITLYTDGIPGGWFFGIDIPFQELVNELNTGYPFSGTLDGAGASTFGPIPGVPSGLTIYAVSAQFAPGFGPFLSARSAVTYTIP